jgi:hypothetical protein
LGEEESRNLDLSSITFEQFLEFFFARDILPDDQQFDCFRRDSKGQPFDDVIPSFPGIVVEHMTRVFSDFGSIATRYSLRQVNQGIWGILGEGLRLHELLWDSSVPLSKRVQCIRSMYSVYSDFVAKSNVEVMENCFWMWWDFILYGFWFQQKLFERHVKMGDFSKLDGESSFLLDVIFETLKRILDLPDSRSQESALHGFGHLHHPAVKETVQEFINSHRNELTGDRLRWVEECRDGTVM